MLLILRGKIKRKPLEDFKRPVEWIDHLPEDVKGDNFKSEASIVWAN